MCAYISMLSTDEINNDLLPFPTKNQYFFINME